MGSTKAESTAILPTSDLGAWPGRTEGLELLLEAQRDRVRRKVFD